MDVSAEQRYCTGIEPLDRVLGGGIVVGSVVLLGGEPGMGKSTLLAQLLACLPCERLLYASGEESVDQVAMRARRVHAAQPRIQLVAETDVDCVIAHATELAVEVVAVDSIQTLSSSEIASPPGSVAQVRECTARLASFAKGSGTSIIVIGHVTKDGALAGPKTLEHLVDVVLQFESGDGDQRQLRANKNRYGSTLERGAFRMHADGLHAVEVEEEGAEPVNPLAPVTLELLDRFLEIGGTLDGGLRSRLAGLADLDPRLGARGARI